MRNPDLQYLDEADTIDDLGSRVLLLFMAKAGIRDNLHGALKMRFRWAGGSAQSLERVVRRPISPEKEFGSCSRRSPSKRSTFLFCLESVIQC